MPRAQKGWQGAVGGVLIIALIVLFGACAKKPPKKPKERPTAMIPERKIPSIPESLTPKREASQKMVEMGREYLQAGEVDKAVHTFQEAVNVDPENGVAYFFLARGLARGQNFDDALGILDKADALLFSNKDWRREIAALREAIEEEKEGKIREKGEEREGYY